MKILLINPPGWQDGSVSLGLAYLSAALLRDGHTVKVFDFTGQNILPVSIAARVNAWEPDIVGFHVKTAQANTASGISRAIKKIYPRALHVAGGPHITLCWQEYMRENPEFECCFTGEADKSFPQFCRALGAGRCPEGIPGTVVKGSQAPVVTPQEVISTLDNLPLPNFDVVEDFSWKDFRYPLLTSRGCPYQCQFCSVPYLSGGKFRYRSPQNCIAELTRVKAEKNITSFEILDDNFTLLMDRAKEFCRELIKADLNLSWYCHNGIRADKLDDELAGLMKKAGCTSVAFGVESGDPAVFQRINKGETLEHIVQAIGIAKNAGLQTVGYFIIGLPGDSLNAVKTTIRFQKSLHLDHFVYGIFIPYPGTRGRDEVLKEGRLLCDIKEVKHFSDRPEISVDYPYFTRDEIEEAYYLAAAGELADLLQKWRIKGPIGNVLYVEMNPPTHGYRRFTRWVKGGMDLLINAAFDGCFEQDKKEGWVRNIFTYEHLPYRFAMIRQLVRTFLNLRTKQYKLVLFPFNRRKSILLALWAIGGAEHPGLYDFEGSRFVEMSFSNPDFFRLLIRYADKKAFGAERSFSSRLKHFALAILNCAVFVFQNMFLRLLHLAVCLNLRFGASEKQSKEQSSAPS